MGREERGEKIRENKGRTKKEKGHALEVKEKEAKMVERKEKRK